MGIPICGACRRPIEERVVTALGMHSGPENLKKSRPKNLVKSNKSIFTEFFLTKFHFLLCSISKMAKEFFDLFDFTSFFVWTF